MEIKLVETVKNTATVSASIPQNEVEEEQNHVLAELAKETTIKGFRKGKAPVNLVKDSLDPDKLKQRTVIHLLDHVIIKVIKDLKLKIVGNPQLIKSETEKEAWGFTLAFPLYPEVALGDYQEKVKKAKEKEKPDTEDKKIKVVFDVLIDGIQFDVPQALIDEEVNRALSRLVSQTETLNLSVADYLKSIKKTPEQLKEEYQKTAVESLKLDFILIAVTRDQKFEVTDEEIKKFQKTAGVDDNQAPYLKSILLKRKAVDYLLKL